MPMVLCELKALVAHLAILEVRITADLATLLPPLSHLPKRAKKSNFPPPPITTTNYRLPKTEVEGSEKKRGLEGECTRHQGNPKTLNAGESTPPPCPSSSAKPTQCTAPSTPLQLEESSRVCCTLWVPDSITGHLISHVGCNLKLATDISKAHITVSKWTVELGALRKATIHGTSEEVRRALVVGKRIAQQHVPNPGKPLKPVKRLTPSHHPPPVIS
jgi:hypothetical protein